MKKIKVVVIDKHILELAEDSQKGDQIDLYELTKIDTSFIEDVIEKGKDEVYNNKINEYRKVIQSENKVEINKLLSEIEILKKEYENNFLVKAQELEKKYQEKLNMLQQEITKLESENNNVQQTFDDRLKFKLKEQELELEKKYQETIIQLKNNLELSQQTFNYQLNDQKNKFELKLIEEIDKQKEQAREELQKKDEQILTLTRQKALLNVKQTGENLEEWCNNEILSYMQSGLFNCTWQKDNVVVKELGEEKGSKADFIFKIYANELHRPNELLASICLEMKDENPDSLNRKTNSSYFKALNKNREKKECQYAVLVSNLEMDSPNLPPIYKAVDYENMYVVRPAYMMTFLNMIVSLTTRFSKIILSNEDNILELKTKNEIIDLFENIKYTYLDKPLASLKGQLDDIIKKTATIRESANTIDEICEKIRTTYINQIEEKINKFTLKFDKKIVNRLE